MRKRYVCILVILPWLIAATTVAPNFMKIWDGTDVVQVNSDGQMHVVMEGKIDSNNSTETPLGGGAVFTGTATDILAFSGISILVGSDVAGTLAVQYGPDGADWHAGESYTIDAGADKFFTPPIQSAYYRLVYTNGGAGQSTFYIHAVLKRQAIKWSGHNIEDPIVDDDDAELVKAVITGKKASGAYDNVSLTNGGNMKASLEELESGISSNSNSQLNVTQFSSDGNEGMQLQDESGTAYGVKHVGNKPRVSSMDYLYDIAEGNIGDHLALNKFGHNETVGATWETIWTASNVYPYMTVADQLEVLSDDADDDDTDTGAWTVNISGLDGNWDEANETITMDGATPVTTTGSYIRVFRAKVVTAGTSGVNEGTITIRDQDTDVSRAEIDEEIGQTLMAVWTVPDGYTFYMSSWYAGSAVSKALDVGVFVRDNAVSDASWQNKQLINFSDTTFKNDLEMPIMFTERTDIEVRAKAGGGGGDMSAGFNGWYEL